MTKFTSCVVMTVAIAAWAAFVPGLLGAQDGGTGIVKGVVMNRDGNGQARAGVLLRSNAGPTRDIVQTVLTDSAGAYTFRDVRAGEYVVESVPAGGDEIARSSVTIAPGAEATRNLVVPTPKWSDPRTLQARLFTVGVVLLYLLLLLLFRFYNIIAPARALLLAQLDSVGTRLKLEVADEQDPQVSVLQQQLESIRDTLGTVSWGSTLFWSRGEEIAAWARIHEVERQLVSLLAPVARVLERAQTAEAELRTKAAPEAILLADRIRDTLRVLSTAAADPLAADPTLIESSVIHLKQELGEALAIIYGDRDTKFAALMEWQNKAMWMTNVALLVIAVMSIVFGHEELFLVGAAGGLMSRMARALFREDVPTDYGASWTTLFLSPLLGAIAAWFGILLIVSLRHFGVLGEEFDRVVWPPENNALTLALAFLLGFSERLFTSLVSAAEGQVQSRIKGDRAGGGGGPAPVPPTPGGIPLGTGGAAMPGGPPAPADQVVRLLDVTPGERAAFIGDSESAARRRLVGAVGAANVFAINDVMQLESVAPVDAVLLERLPELAGLKQAAAVIERALAPRGRLVVVGSTAAGSFEADAQSQEQQGQVGPALVHAAMTGAQLLAQEPAERLEGTESRALDVGLPQAGNCRR